MNINSRIGKYGIIDKNHLKNGSERKNNVSGAELQSGFNSFHTDNSISINKNGSLSNAVSTQLSFKGLNASWAKVLREKAGTTWTNFLKNFKPDSTTISKQQVDQVLNLLKDKERFNPITSRYFAKAVNSYHHLINKSGDITIKKPSLQDKFINAATSPLMDLRDIALFVFNRKEYKKGEVLKNLKQRLRDFETASSIIEKSKGNVEEAARILRGNIRKNSLQKGHSVNILTTLNRIVSGVIPAIYLSFDAMNNVTKICGNGKEVQKDARKEGTSRFKQEVARVGLSAYLGYVAQTVFKGFCNQNMFNALLVQGVVVAATEILGRTLIGKPFLPMTKAQFEKRKKEHPEEIKAKKSSESKSDKKLSFSGGVAQQTTKSIEDIMLKKSYKKNVVVRMVRKILRSEKTPEFVKDTAKTVRKAYVAVRMPLYRLGTKWNKISEVEFTNLSNFERYVKASPQDAKDIVRDLVRAINPVNVQSKITKNGKEIVTQIADKGTLNVAEAYRSRFVEATENLDFNLPNEEFIKKFIDALKDKDIITLPVGKKSPLRKQIANNILSPIFAPIIILGKTSFKDVENIAVSTNPLKSVEKLVKNCHDPMEFKNKLNKIISKAHEGSQKSGKANYNTTVYSVFNRFFAGAITGTFLVADVKNQTMQYTDGNEKVADEAGKSRVAQEAARLSFSTYIMNVTHSFFSNIYNSSLPGAAAVTAANVLFTETMARLVVGMPIGPASKETIEKNEAKMTNSKNPVIKFLAQVMGKRKKSAPAASTPKTEDKKAENKDTSKKSENKTASTAKPVIKDLMNDFLSKKKPALNK